MMTSIVREVAREEESESLWSRLSLQSIAILMFTIAVAWRIVDVLILGLGDTLVNILPSKLFPLLIMVGLFWRYRRSELESVLGLSRNNLRSHIAIGLVVGVAMYLLIDAGGVILYALFIDSSYPLALTIPFVELLWYQLIFFALNAFLEETLFRGLIQNSLRTRHSVNFAILVSAVIFGLWHIIWPIVNGFSSEIALNQVASMVAFGIIFGAFMGVFYEKFTKRSSLLGPIIAHTLVNFFNESFRLGPEPAIQGPDVIYGSPALLGLTMAMFIGTFIVLFYFVTRYTLDDLRDAWKRLAERIPIEIPQKNPEVFKSET